jgi:hypothetical protein
LGDNGAGTLRACAEASGPRTCIFRVAGTIELDSEIIVKHPFLTIAGQSAPGGGVQIKNRNSTGMAFFVQASDIIIRHIRVRPGPTVTISDRVNCFTLGSEVQRVERIILANVSCSWTTDQLMATTSTDIGAITVQDSLFYEGLSRSTHTKGEHSKGPNFRACALPGVTFLRSMISDNTDRNINFSCEGQINFVNNVVYNARSAFTTLYRKRGSETANFIGNHYIAGPSTVRNSDWPYGIDAPDYNNTVPGSTISLYVSDNVGEGMPNGTARPLPIFSVVAPYLAQYISPSPLGQVTESILPAASAYNLVLGRSGAFPRDASDLRAINEVVTRGGKIIDHPSEVGGWPVLAPGTPYPDSDQDGMDDAWEVARGISNPVADHDGDGYTNLEEFLNEKADLLLA